MAVPTLTEIRERWPALTSSVISDDDLTAMRTEAGNRVPTSALTSADDTTARIHLTAHLALGFVQASSIAGMAAGVQVAQSASFRDRSATRQANPTTMVKARSMQEADLMTTAPGRMYLSIVQNILPTAVYAPSPC